MKTEADSKNHKKKKFKKRYWILIDLAVAAIILALLLYTPSGYEPITGSDADQNSGRVHPYLTYLSAKIYNGAQLQEPFKVTVIEQKLNEAIAGWSQMSEDVVLSAPAVRFLPHCIELMGTASIKGVDLVVTIVLEPKIDANGLLNLHVDKVKTGAMNITPLARVVARNMYEQHLANTDVDTEDWRTKIAGSLLNGEPFEPVFPVEDKKVRLEKADIQNENLTLHLAPAS